MPRQVPRTAPIFGFNQARDAIVADVVDRVCARTKDAVYALSDAAHCEMKRLGPSSGEAARWRHIARRLGRMDETEARDALRALAVEHARDVAGNFDPRVYALAAHLVPPLLAALLNPRSLAGTGALAHFLDAGGIADRVLLDGPVDRIRALCDVGTVVYVPTHLSNMDSIVFGFALERCGLPPASYGAGKNLFTNPLLSFFMHNLGAYRVDRRLRHAVYKDVLKTYSCVLLERGYHSLFFPGGTRSRSGCVERRLKLGLMGTGIEAFARTLRDGAPRRVFFVPATINYLLVLEAETLIDDFLQEEGKARYIIEDDESSRIGRMHAFTRKLLGLEASVAVRFGDPLDPVGNRVDDRGRSFDARGREVDPASYVRDRRGEPTVDPARDAQYTRELGEALCAAYARHTVVMPTHLVAAACFDRLRRAHGGDGKRGAETDLFAILRHRADLVVPRADLCADVERLLGRAVAEQRAGRLVLAPTVMRARGAEVVDLALRAFAGYHTTPIVVPAGDGLGLHDGRLLLYYQNRLALHGLAFDPLTGRTPERPPWRSAA